MVSFERIAAQPYAAFEVVRIGDADDNCKKDSKKKIIDCNALELHVEFTTPISDDELASHTHPPLQRDKLDRRGHRATTKLVPLPDKKLVLVLDGALTDVLGRTLGATQTYEIHNHW
jgi:hypothetical protein